VSSAEPAFEVLEQSAVDIRLVGLKLPGMSGLDLRKRVTELTPKYLCFVLTPYGTIDSAIQGHALSALSGQPELAILVAVTSGSW
jgi:DNA-binding NtrC family response regulator